MDNYYIYKDNLKKNSTNLNWNFISSKELNVPQRVLIIIKGGKKEITFEAIFSVFETVSKAITYSMQDIRRPVLLRNFNK